MSFYKDLLNKEYTNKTQNTFLNSFVYDKLSRYAKSAMLHAAERGDNTAILNINDMAKAAYMTFCEEYDDQINQDVFTIKMINALSDLPNNLNIKAANDSITFTANQITDYLYTLTWHDTKAQ